MDISEGGSETDEQLTNEKKPLRLRKYLKVFSALKCC